LTYRITFAVRDRARFLSHLETVDTLLSALRRGGFEIALSKGMKPRPVISLALPRAVGVESEGEVAEVQLVDDTTTELLSEGLAPQLPAGLTLLSVEPAESKPAASRIAAARYRVEVADDLDWPAAVHRYAALEHAVVVRHSLGKAAKEIDVKRFCPSVDYTPGVLTAQIDMTGAGTARPEELATAVAATVGATPTINRLVRTEIVLHDVPVGALT
jgi:radical SAM-linked protein